jgi:hypothetical protein
MSSSSVPPPLPPRSSSLLHRSLSSSSSPSCPFSSSPASDKLVRCPFTGVTYDSNGGMTESQCPYGDFIKLLTEDYPRYFNQVIHCLLEIITGRKGNKWRIGMAALIIITLGIAWNVKLTANE